MTDILASIGLVELARYDSETLIERKRIVEQYDAAFSILDWAIVPVHKDENRTSSYHLYLLRIKGITLEQRNAIIQKIFDKDVSVNVHFKPLPLLTAYKSRGYKIEDYPISNALWENEISLPIFFGLDKEKTNIVIQAVINSYQEVLGS